MSHAAEPVWTVRSDAPCPARAQVWKRCLKEPKWAKGMPPIDVPKPEATCRIRYTVRAAGGGGGVEAGTLIAQEGTHDSVLEFVHGERTVLPCVEMAVVQMKRGERALLTAPASLAYAAPNFSPATPIDAAHRNCDVEVRPHARARGGSIRDACVPAREWSWECACMGVPWQACVRARTGCMLAPIAGGD